MNKRIGLGEKTYTWTRSFVSHEEKIILGISEMPLTHERKKNQLVDEYVSYHGLFIAHEIFSRFNSENQLRMVLQTSEEQYYGRPSALFEQTLVCFRGS